jgi:hypothetical protein
MEISINTKTRLQVMTWSLVFVFKLISTFIIGQNKEFLFMHACDEEGCSASLCIAHEKKT